MEQTLNIYYNDINKEYPFFNSKLFFSVEIVVRFAVPAKKSGTVGTVPTVPGATAVCYIKKSELLMRKSAKM